MMSLRILDPQRDTREENTEEEQRDTEIQATKEPSPKSQIF